MRLARSSLPVIAGLLCAFGSAQGIAITYDHVFVPGFDEEAARYCQASRKEYGSAYKQHYKLENVLTSCQPIDAGQGRTGMAIIFAFEPNPSTPEFLPALEMHRLTSPWTYVATLQVPEARTRTRTRWNGADWITQEETYYAVVPVSEARFLEFDELTSCKNAAAVLMSGNVASMQGAMTSHCFQAPETGEWTLNILAVSQVSESECQEGCCGSP